MAAPIVIIGAGQAAASFISRHVALGNEQPLLLVGEESHPPYQRPPLSKKYLLGELERERLFIRPLQWYADQAVELRFDTRIDRIDRARKQIHRIRQAAVVHRLQRPRAAGRNRR
jgi:3-phenylpropionate/trans-cinnamate dioxygenase ferredoxin reductase subunit